MGPDATGVWIHPLEPAGPYDFAMLSDIDPMAVTLVVVAVAIVGSIIGVARRGRSEPTPNPTVLPAGADAALWSITEVLPDPRNHLAIKDPTSELRLTVQQRAEAAQALAAPQVRPADAARSAQSQAARQAALAKRAVPRATAPQASEPVETVPVVAPAGTGDIVLATAEVADERHLTLLPEHLDSVDPVTAIDGHGHRWGETPARAS
jgi:hypothetical protein